jgi:hypothetical protein
MFPPVKALYFYYDFGVYMQDINVQELISQIIKQAEENTHTEFHLVDSWSEFSFYREQRRSLRVVLKALRESADDLFKTYCKEVSQGTADFTKLLAYQEFQDIVEYYDIELQVIHSMILEYLDYLASGHFLSALSGNYRSNGG